MTAPRGIRVLTINCGSSSLKAAVYEIGPDERRVLSLQATRIGLPGSRIRIADAGGACILDAERALPAHAAALDFLLGWIARHPSLTPDVAGHRVVHGGLRLRDPAPVTPELLVALDALLPIDPDHMPHAIAGIRGVERAYPGLRQVACFDTGFHRDLPPVARRYALPQSLADAGIVRYGFHGLSYEYVMGELRALDPAAALGRVILAHLGNGASLAAVQGGRSVDTTMGFSPTGGLVMGTRSGDLDPGVVIHLLRERRLTPDEAAALLSRESGLRGVSGTSGDMRDLLQRERSDPHAAEAIALFCYQGRKHLGACVAALGGLDALVFTAGIGEHAAPVRERICAGLDFLGLELDPARNARHAAVISSDESRVRVRVIPTNEELMVARHASRLAAGDTRPGPGDA